MLSWITVWVIWLSSSHQSEGPCWDIGSTGKHTRFATLNWRKPFDTLLHSVTHHSHRSERIKSVSTTKIETFRSSRLFKTPPHIASRLNRHIPETLEKVLEFTATWNHSLSSALLQAITVRYPLLLIVSLLMDVPGAQQQRVATATTLGSTDTVTVIHARPLP
jgi:hypothetical protein